MPGQQRNECRKAPEYAVSALPIQTALQYAQFWMKDLAAGCKKLQRRKCIPTSLQSFAEKSRSIQAFTDKDNVSQPNRKYYMHLKHLNEHYAHQVSKEIMDFCKENQTGILVLPEYDEDFSRISMYRSGNYSPLHLSIRIRNYLKYKAWAEGILVLELRADRTEKQCSIMRSHRKKTRQCIHLSECHQSTVS